MSWNYRYARWDSYGYWSDYYWNDDGSSSQGSYGPPEEMDYVYLDGYTPEGYGDSYMPSSGEFYSFDTYGLSNTFYLNGGALYVQYAYPTSYVDGGYIYCSYSFSGDQYGDMSNSVYVTMVYNSESYQSIDANGYSLGHLTIDNSGVSSCQANGYLACEDFQIYSGEFDLNGYTLTANGNFTLGGGTIYGNYGTLEVDGDATYSYGDAVDLDLRMTGGGATLDWYVYNDDRRLQSLTVGSGADVTLANHLYTEALHIESGGTLNPESSRRVLLYWPSGDGFLSCDGSCQTSVDVTIFSDRYNYGNVTGVTNNVKFYTTSGNLKTLTQYGDIQASSDIEVSNLQNDSGYSTLDMRGGLTCDTLRLGAPTAVNGSGRIKMGDRVHSLNYITKGNSANTNNAMDLQGCAILPPQIIDGEYISVTSAGANIHGGIVRSLNSAGIVHLWGPEDGSHSNSIDVVTEGSNASPCGTQMGIGAAA